MPAVFQGLTGAQLLIAGVLYIAYLCFVMFGGMRKKKASLRRFIPMIVLLVWALTQTYAAPTSTADLLDVALVGAVALVKGLYLGRKKHVEQIDGTYYIWHDTSYIAAWGVFFVGKLLLTQGLSHVTGAEFPLWHMVFYFCLYFSLRSAVIVRLHPEAFSGRHRR